MYVLALIVSLFGPPTGLPTAKQVDKNAQMGDAKVIHRGAPFALKASDTTMLDTIAADPKAYAGKMVRVSATVERVCKKKGCWMQLKGKTAGARVTFKDYGFFVPLDCQGAIATVEGKVEIKTLSAEERAHLAGDEGVPVEKVAAVELRLIATAAEVRRDKP